MSQKKGKIMKRWDKAWAWQLQRRREALQNPTISWCGMWKGKDDKGPTASWQLHKVHNLTGSQHIIILLKTRECLFAYCFRLLKSKLAQKLTRWKRMKNALAKNILGNHKSPAVSSAQLLKNRPWYNVI